MKINLIIFLLTISFVFSVFKVDRFPYGVYNLIVDEKNFLVYNNDKIDISFSHKLKKEANFRIRKLSNNNYHIENLNGDMKLSGEPGKVKFVPKNLWKITDTLEWTFIESNYDYGIKNKYGCFIALSSSKITCKNTKVENAIQFKISKLYEEVNHSDDDIKLIENEPIDALIKYIDLKDPTLVREGIQQMKDEDKINTELKYTIRSILKNIPWIRKIFILMPNDKVSFFKEYELIKEKIVYVKDKDLIGFDSSNSQPFQFRSWMMTKFNMSENFIFFDENCFIGKPLKKTDFFYIHNGGVVPAIITNTFDILDDKDSNKKANKKVLRTIQNSYSYITKLRYKPPNFPLYTHNAIPCNIKEIQELYYLIYNSEYRYGTLDTISKYDKIIHFQTFYMGYFFNEHNKKINNIPYENLDIEKALTFDFNYDLFSIDTNSKKSSYINYEIAKIVLVRNFPEPTPYEIYDFQEVSNISFNAIFEKEKQNKEIKRKINIMVIVIIILILLLIRIVTCKKKEVTLKNNIISEEIELVKQNSET